MSRAASPADQVRARLAELADPLVGAADGLPRPAAPTAPIERTAAAGSKASPTREAQGGGPLVAPAPRAPAAPLASAAEVLAAPDLVSMRALLLGCRDCKLCERRTQVVFGTGHPQARVMFVGEGPGHDEDVRGEPFVGRAGQLLTEMIEKGLGIPRADVYIANVVKCRPPENRNPEPDEIAACSPFLARQIALVGPRVLVALGKFAAQTLLQTQAPISRLRGRWHDHAGTPLMPTFHPAYLLRSPGEKRAAWSDLQLVLQRLQEGADRSP